ncbi:hypothetical protein GCM10010981_37880 [Dyella nitratireducens]|uniref:Uncharacterized protein n=1 Tax=Dyella nitratireducens TaxID=1849580 RepID=A0ABQ1GK47_9GAMM|nr:hypothetical protein GCM10010981_37880 [Dyella nitratireducens]
MIWLCSSEPKLLPWAMLSNISRTLASLSVKAGNDAVDADAGPAFACAMGCWMVDDALAGC